MFPQESGNICLYLTPDTFRLTFKTSSPETDNTHVFSPQTACWETLAACLRERYISNVQKCMIHERNLTYTFRWRVSICYVSVYGHMHTQRVHQSKITPWLHSERQTTKSEGKRKLGNGCEGGLVSVDSRVDSSSPVWVCGSVSLPVCVCQHYTSQGAL